MLRATLGLMVVATAFVCRLPQALGNEEQLAAAVTELASEDLDTVTAGVTHMAASGSPRAPVILRALVETQLNVDAEHHLFVTRKNKSLLASTGEEITPVAPLRAVPVNNTIRRLVDEVLSRLELTSDSADVRLQAASDLAEHPDQATADLMRPLLAHESDERVTQKMQLALAKIDLASPSKELRIAAARFIAASSDVTLKDRLETLTAKHADGSYEEPDVEVRAAYQAALSAVSGRLLWIRTVANAVYGLSLGSVLLLAALGLAITFGLMGVINMAHGEMLMIGAYATFVVETFFARHLPSLSDWYLVAAVPVAFLVTGALGIVLERTVIRFLYGRPLETLLATWGLSLFLIQGVRWLFGAQNVTVANPSWLSGGWELMPTLVIPYSRAAVLAFTAVVVVFVWFVLQKTSLGLRIRAVTQNREMAASLGVPTHRVDMLAFGLGSAVAGLGGVALSQLGNVGPELGQQHIIDSFMVVVVGGVGNVIGTILGAMGLGIASKFLEPSFGAVLGKILILGLLILFIQWRPQGLFALKGRAHES